MKPFLCLLLFISILFFPECKKTKPAIDQLPPETQTGAGTFGCLIHGKVFKPKGEPFAGSVSSASYQYLNSELSKGYFFSVNAKNSNSNGLTLVYVNTDSLSIQQGQTIVLEKFGKKGSASAGYYIGMISTSTEYLTTLSVTGELKITKFDETQRIVSGTFWFDAVNDKGEKVQVREGRFDMHYTL